MVKLLVNDDDMRVVRGMHGDRILESLPLQVALPAGEGTSVKFSILPLRNGYLPVQVTARSEAAADSVIRYLLVEVRRPLLSAESNSCNTNSYTIL